MGCVLSVLLIVVSFSVILRGIVSLVSSTFFSSSDNFFVDDFARFTVLESKDKTAAVANSMTYLTKKGNTCSGL